MAAPDPSSEPLRRHVRQQEALATLGQLALSSDDLDELFEEAAASVRTALGAEYAAVFERSADDALALRRGSGWDDGTETAVVSPSEPPIAAAMGGTEPVVVADLGTRPDRPHRLFVDHGVASGISAPVGCPNDPWGVLGVYATEAAAFVDHDATFVGNVANVLTSAIENARTRGRLRREETVKERIVETSPIGIVQLSGGGEIEFANDRAAEILGRDRTRLESMANDDPDWEFVDDDGESFTEELPSERVLRDGERVFGVEIGVRNGAGERIWLSVNGEPLRDDGEVTGAVLALEDVTERRRLEGELEEVFGRVTDAFYALDDRWRFTHVNERAEELLDVAGEGLIGRTVWEAFEWAADSTVREEYERAMETQEPTSFELYYPEPLDTWFVVDAYPSETGLSVYFRDVSDRKAIERVRDESNRTLKRLHAIASDRGRSFDEKVHRLLELGRDRLGVDVGYLARVDADGDRFEVTHASGESEQAHPGATMPLSKTYCRRVVESDDLLAFADSPRDAIDDDVYDVWELDCYIGGRVTVDGDLYGTLCFEDESPRSRPFSAAERTFVELAIQWISYELERKRRSERLERYREYTGDVLDAIDDVFYVVDEGGDLLRWNESATDVTGYSDAEIESMGALEFFDEAEAERVADAIADCFASGSARVETAIRTKGGERVDYEFVASTLETPDGETVLAGIGREITDRLERERELEESNERLEQFAYAASHDLQEPLRMVSSYLTLLDRRYTDELDDDAEEFIGFAVDGAERMQAMIDGLLAYSRIDTRGDPFEPVDCEAVLADVRSDLAMKIAETDAEIDVESLPRVYGDPDQLRQLFQNLLSNALTYAGEDPPRITVSAEKRDSTRAVSVRDRGIGIDPADQERIFDVFDRLHTREEYDGTGIGLALCQRIAERHGGDIEVESTPGEGSTFTVTLPALPDAY